MFVHISQVLATPDETQNNTCCTVGKIDKIILTIRCINSCNLFLHCVLGDELWHAMSLYLIQFLQHSSDYHSETLLMWLINFSMKKDVYVQKNYFNVELLYSDFLAGVTMSS